MIITNNNIVLRICCRVTVHNERGHHTRLDVADHGGTAGTRQPDPYDGG